MNQLDISQKTPAESISNSIGCCSRYRQCSDAGHCIATELDCSAKCLYRKSLEAGKIFYGKNATAFNMAVYNGYTAAYKTLGESEKDVLHSLLYYFFVEKRGIIRGLFLERKEIFTLSDLGFVKLVDYPSIIIEKYTFSALKKACGGIPNEAIEWAKNNYCKTPEDVKKWDERKGSKIYKEEFVRWILLFAPDVVKALCKGICNVEVDLDTRLELEEFFLDYFNLNEFKSSLQKYTEDDRFAAEHKR